MTIPYDTLNVHERSSRLVIVFHYKFIWDVRIKQGSCVEISGIKKPKFFFPAVDNSSQTRIIITVVSATKVSIVIDF